MSALRVRRAAFRALHQSGTFVMPNPWDAGSAIRLEKLGFRALASTSAGAAWALGKDDGGMNVDEVLQHLRGLVAATTLPVNADFEAGFADDPRGVAANVSRCIETGVAGLSIEDYHRGALLPIEVATERICAARRAVDDSGQDVVLTARCECFLRGQPDLQQTIARLRAYSRAGADCLYAPAVRDRAAIEELVQSVDRPVNVLLSTTALPVDELARLGVRRISIGGSLARISWTAFDQAARHLVEQGRLPGAS